MTKFFALVSLVAALGAQTAVAQDVILGGKQPLVYPDQSEYPQAQFQKGGKLPMPQVLPQQQEFPQQQDIGYQIPSQQELPYDQELPLQKLPQVKGGYPVKGIYPQPQLTPQQQQVIIRKKHGCFFGKHKNRDCIHFKGQGKQGKGKFQQQQGQVVVPGQQFPSQGQFPGQLPDQFPGQLPDQFPSQLPGQIPSQLPDQFPSQLPGQIPSQLPEQLPGQDDAGMPVAPAGEFPFPANSTGTSEEPNFPL